MAVSDDFGTHKPVKINTFTEFRIFKQEAHGQHRSPEEQ